MLVCVKYKEWRKNTAVLAKVVRYHIVPCSRLQPEELKTQKIRNMGISMRQGRQQKTETEKQKRRQGSCEAGDVSRQAHPDLRPLPRAGPHRRKTTRGP